MPTVLVVNPNSTDAITERIAEATADLWCPPGVTVEVVTSTGGPAAIESDQDGEDAIAPMVALALEHSADAMVIACFSDPGIALLREQTGVPVFGIAESALLNAMGRGRRIGVVSSVAASVPRHERYWDRLGVSGRVVADIPVNRGVLDLSGPEAAADVHAVCRQLVDEHGADVVVLGCAGLAHLRLELQDALGVPVVEPCRAAVSAAVSALGDRADVPVTVGAVS